MKAYRCLFILFCAITLSSCEDDHATAPHGTAAKSAQIPTNQTHQTTDPSSADVDSLAVPGRPEHDPLPPEIVSLPAAMAFDPCGLMADDFAQSLSIPTDQRIERIGGTRKIPQDHRYTPYIGCIWRAVTQAAPRLAVEIQWTAPNLEVNGEPVPGLGEAAWYVSSRGSTQLRLHQNEYVILIRADLPAALPDSKNAYERIANHILNALKSPPNASRVPTNATAFGGPEMNLCETGMHSNLADLLPGPKAWAVPTGATNQVPDEQSARPDADYVGCTFAGTTRGSVQLRYLGPHGVKRQSGFYAKATPVTINGLNGFRGHKGVYLPVGAGAFELNQSMTSFSSDMLPAKLEHIMAQVVANVSQ